MSLNGMYGALNFMEKIGVMANFVKNGVMMFQGMFGHHQQMPPYMQGPSLFGNQPMMDGGMYPMGPQMGMGPMDGGMFPMMGPMDGGMPPMMDGGMPPPPMPGPHGHHHHHHQRFGGFW